MKGITKLMLVLAAVLLVQWAWVDQGRPFWNRAMTLERSAWPAALGDKSLRGVPLYVRCTLNDACQAAVIQLEAKYPIRPVRWFGFLPAALLASAGVALSASRPQRRLYGGRWATRSQYRRLLTSYPSQDGCSILLASSGRRQTEFLAVRAGLGGRREIGHILVVGPSRSGKSLMLLANLVNWQFSVIALDVKGELHRLTSGIRSELGRVVVLNPSGGGDRFDPFPTLTRTEEEMRATARRMMDVHGDKEPIFSERAASGVVAMLRAAQLQGVPALPFIASQIRGRGLPEFILSMREVQDAQAYEALVGFLGVNPHKMDLDITDRFLHSSWSTMVTRLAPYLTDGVLAMTSASCFAVKDLVGAEPLTVYLQFSDRTLDTTRGVFGLIVSALMQGLMDHVDGHPDEEFPPVLLMIDEGGSVPMPNLPELMSMVSSRGVSVMLVVQSLSQLMSAYGQEGATTIKSNAHHTLFHPPRSLETAEEISKLSGRESLDDKRVSEQVGGTGGGRQTVTRGERDRPLITIDEARQLPGNIVLVISDELPLIKAHRIEHWRNPEMTARLQFKPTPIKPRAQRALMAHTTVETTDEAVQEQPSTALIPYVDVD